MNDLADFDINDIVESVQTNFAPMVSERADPSSLPVSQPEGEVKRRRGRPPRKEGEVAVKEKGEVTRKNLTEEVKNAIIKNVILGKTVAEMSFEYDIEEVRIIRVINKTRKTYAKMVDDPQTEERVRVRAQTYLSKLPTFKRVASATKNNSDSDILLDDDFYNGLLDNS